MKGADSKVCIYCNSEFFREEFPRSFDRMVTCGKIECAGKRRKELWHERYDNILKLNSANSLRK